MKLTISILVAVSLIALGAILINQNRQQSPKSFQTSNKISPTFAITAKAVTAPDVLRTEAKASFAIFTHGTFRVFTAAMYHNLSPDVFIEDSNPNIIHVKKLGLTWDDFFRTLPFKLTKDCLTTGTGQAFCSNSSGSLKFYLNSTQKPDALSQPINHGDQLLITYGNETDQQIELQNRQIPVIKGQ
jgi:hypothetical protein